MKVRVIEMRSQPASQSKALAVNPRTLDILEPTGITAKMLAMGKPGVRNAVSPRWAGDREVVARRHPSKVSVHACAFAGVD